MKRKIVCCIDDERSIPDAVKSVVLRNQDVSFYFLRVGYRKDPSRAIDDPVDIIGELDEGRDEFDVKDEDGDVMGLSVVGVAKTLGAIDKSKADVLFACDLRLDNILWPVEWDDSAEFETKLINSKDYVNWENPKVRPGIYLLHRIQREGFKYLLTSRLNISLESNDLGLAAPIDSSTANDTEATAKMVEKNYRREFGLSRKWLNVALGDKSRLKTLSDLLSKQPFRTGDTHDVQGIIKNSRQLETGTINFCRDLLDQLGVNDDDILEARRALRQLQPEVKALGVAKTVAIFHRTSKLRTYLFDLLDIVRHIPNHDVKINKKPVEELSDLIPTVHVALDFSPTGGMIGLDEFFEAHPDQEFSWSHRVQANRSLNTEADTKPQCVYEVEVIPKSSRDHAINIYRLSGSGNVSRILKTLSYLLKVSEVQLIVVRNSFEEEMASIHSQNLKGVFLLVKRTEQRYEIRMFGRHTFGEDMVA